MNARSTALPISLRLLGLTRLILLAWMVITFIITILSLPAFYQRLFDFTPGDLAGSPFYGWTSEQIRAAALDQGVSPSIIAEFQLTARLMGLLCFWVVAGILFWRKSENWSSLIISYLLFFTGQGFSNLKLVDTNLPDWMNPIALFIAAVVWPTFFLMLYLFPNGKFYHRFTRFLVVVPYFVFFLIGNNPGMRTMGQVLLITYSLGGLVSQVYRYRKISTADERQQTKWVVYALAVLIITAFTTSTPLLFFPGWVAGTTQLFWYEFISNGIVGVLIPAFLPIAIGMSILRYRLWDVDLVIRRTLQYTLLTVMLSLVYFGSVALLQSILTGDSGLPTTGAVSSQPSAVVIVLTTLAIAAIFNPLRRRIQEFIDRRFYRQKYDAEKALASFASTARSETNLPALTSSLVSVVEETLHPESVSLTMLAPEKKQLPGVGIAREV